MLGLPATHQPVGAAILVALALAATPRYCLSSQADDAAASCTAGSECVGGGVGEEASLLAVNILHHAAEASGGVGGPAHGLQAARSDLKAALLVSPSRRRRRRPRCRCTDDSSPCWPSAKTWRQLNQSVGGRLFASNRSLPQWAIYSPPASLVDLENPQWNPLWIQNQSELALSVGGHGSSGWSYGVSSYYVAVHCPRDIQKAVNFASKHDLRLVVKGAAHDYLGRNGAPNSLLIWTNRLQKIKWHRGNKEVTVQAGVIWEDVYNQAQQRGRLVVGGSCPTVGAAGGYVLGGGYGEKGFSRLYGTAAENMIKATVITAKGKLLVVSKTSHPRLFWALRGGGGGTFAIVYDITYKTHEAPRIGGNLATFVAAPDLTSLFNFTMRWISFVNSSLLNRSYGLVWYPGRIGRGMEANFGSMYFWNTPRADMDSMFSAFNASLADIPGCKFQYVISMAESITVGGQSFAKLYATQDGEKTIMFGGPRIDSGRPGQWIYQGYSGRETYAYLTMYYSARIPMEDYAKPYDLAMKLAKVREYNSDFYLATGKGLGGDITETGEKISMDPRAWTSGSLLLSVQGLRGYWPGREPTREALALLWERNAEIIEGWKDSFGLEYPEPCKTPLSLTAEDGVRCWEELDKYVVYVSDAYAEYAAPGYREQFNNTGAYVNEADYGEPSWQEQFWGVNYRRLCNIKQDYDPEGLFVCHHCVGSEDWSVDGNCFAPLASQ